MSSRVPPHGDQGMYYSLWATRIDLFMSLDESWNVDRCHSYYGRLARPTAPNASRLPVHILHRNCMASSLPSQTEHHDHHHHDSRDRDDAASPFFNFFKAYPWNWHSGVYPVSIARVAETDYQRRRRRGRQPGSRV